MSGFSLSLLLLVATCYWLEHVCATVDIHYDLKTEEIWAVITEGSCPEFDPSSPRSESWRFLPYISLDPSPFDAVQVPEDLTTGDSLSLAPSEFQTTGIVPQTYADVVSMASPYESCAKLNDVFSTPGNLFSPNRAQTYLVPPLNPRGIVESVHTSVPVDPEESSQFDLSFHVVTSFAALAKVTKTIRSAGISLPILDPLNPLSFKMSLVELTASTQNARIAWSEQFTFDRERPLPLTHDDVVLVRGFLPSPKSPFSESVLNTDPISNVVSQSSGYLTYIVTADDAIQYALGVAIKDFAICRGHASLFKDLPRCDPVVPLDRIYQVWKNYAVTPECERRDCVPAEFAPKTVSEPEPQIHNSRFRALLRNDSDTSGERPYIRAGDAISVKLSAIVDAIGPLETGEMYFADAVEGMTPFSPDPVWLWQFQGGWSPRVPSRRLLAGSSELVKGAYKKESAAVVGFATTTVENCPHPFFDGNGAFLGCVCEFPRYARDGSIIACERTNGWDLTTPGWIAGWVVFSLFICILFWALVWCTWEENAWHFHDHTHEYTSAAPREQRRSTNGTGPSTELDELSFTFATD